MSEDLDLRRSIQEAFAQLPVGEPRREPVLRRARRLRLRKVLTTGAVAVFLTASIVTPIELLWPIGRSGPAAPAVDEFGIRLDFPARWDFAHLLSAGDARTDGRGGDLRASTVQSRLLVPRDEVDGAR